MSRDNQEYLSDPAKLMSKVYLNVIFNWHTISQNQQVMDGLDMNTNTMCHYFKTHNPSLRDSYVQAHVLSVLLMTWIIVATPIETIFTEIDKSINAQFTRQNLHSPDSILPQENTQNLDVD